MCFVLCLKHLRKSDYSAGVNVEVKTKVEEFGDIWVSGIAIMEKDEELLVKYKSLRGEEDDEWTKTSVPYSQVRPPPPPFDSRAFGLTEHVDALLDSGWCPSVVSKVLCGERYTVLLGPNKQSRDFDQSQLRPSMEWKDGAWVSKEKVPPLSLSIIILGSFLESKHALKSECVCRFRIKRRVFLQLRKQQQVQAASG